MKKLPVLFYIVCLFSFHETSGSILLTAITHPGNTAVTLQWNMADYPGSTAYTLFKSADGVVWEISAANPVFRNYTSSTILAYRDNFSNQQKLYYRVKIYDIEKNIVDLSNTAVAENPKRYSTVETLPQKNRTVTDPGSNSSNAWQIYPDPVSDILNLYYRESKTIKGIINVIIENTSGKIVGRFRAASNNRQLHIPTANLHAGLYFIKINVGNEIQLNEKFIKQ
ncbi:MAG: T9SS type A sorting domain-containing protein [Ginsengibacter sp.]